MASMQRSVAGLVEAHEGNMDGVLAYMRQNAQAYDLEALQKNLRKQLEQQTDDAQATALARVALSLRECGITMSPKIKEIVARHSTKIGVRIHTEQFPDKMLQMMLGIRQEAQTTLGMETIPDDPVLGLAQFAAQNHREEFGGTLMELSGFVNASSRTPSAPSA